MANRVYMVTLLVPDYDEAINYFTKTLGFSLLEDEKREEDKRWVVIGFENGFHLLLAKAKGAQTSSIGNQFGGRVGFFLETDEFDKTYAEFLSQGVNFLEPVRSEAYGKVVKFSDMFGNKWDLISAPQGKQ